MSELAEALVALREHVGLFQAAGMVLEAVEAAGGIAEVIARLEEECAVLQDKRDGLAVEVMMLKRDRERAAGGPGKGEDDHE